MRMPWSRISRILSAHYLERRARVPVLLVVAATVLDLAAAAGLAYVVGFGKVRAVLGDFQGGWIIALLGALLVSAVGYYHAYRGVFRVDGGPRLPRRELLAVAIAGFGGHLAHGGGPLDQYALRAAGADEDQAKVRAVGLAGLEHGVLSIIGTGTAIAVLALGLGKPPASFTLPWALLPVPGFLIAFWAAERYRYRFHGRPGWRGRAGIFLDSIHVIRELFVHPLRWWPAVLGMALFWAADAFAAWAGLAAFGFQMDAAALYVGFATGMLFTRRTGPLAGAGLLALVLPMTISGSGAPFAVAIVGVMAYRVLPLWLSTPVSLAVLPTLRQMGQRQAARLPAKKQRAR
jgi:hypothetical protein